VLNRRNTPAAPAELSEASRDVWRRIHKSWSMDDSGRVLLTIALQARDRAAAAQALIDKDGLTLGARAHPAVAVLRDAENVCLKAWRQLGLEASGPVGRPPGKGPA
jgi:phage terminase small subunit